MRVNTQKIKPQPVQMLLSLMLLGVLSMASMPSHANSSWTKKSFAIKGGWSIVEKNGSRVLSLDQNFHTKNAPDLKLFLSTKSLGDLSGRNATEGSLLISPLKSNKGAQEYVLPANVDINQFRTLIIHCEAYSKLWGGANL